MSTSATLAVGAAKGVPYCKNELVFIKYVGDYFRIGEGEMPDYEPKAGEILCLSTVAFEAKNPIAIEGDPDYGDQVQIQQWCIKKKSGEVLGLMDPAGQWFTIEARPQLGQIEIGDTVQLFGNREVTIADIQHKHGFNLHRIIDAMGWAYPIHDIREVTKRAAELRKAIKVLSERIFSWMIGNGQKTQQQIAYQFGYDLNVAQALHLACKNGILRIEPGKAGEDLYEEVK